ncbi:MAG TPA: enoyl-CoA hydratase/isomerase family protein [Acidimicrobiales bacterium]|nr:enoyl-CoA hydratase/isomerase family protein [Acidimicrobiales bacterium]
MGGPARGAATAAPDHLVRLEGSDGVAVLTLDRAERLNAIGTETIAALRAAVREIAADPAVRSVVVTGEGRVFCAGADIAEFSSFTEAREFEAFITDMAGAFSALSALPKPSVAAVNGHALGGGLELALACDLRVASAGALLGVPEVKLGLLPGATGTARLTRMLAPGVAKQLLMTGEPVTADEALRLGLVNQVAEDGPAAVALALDLARRLAALPTGALAAAKRLVDDGAELSLDDAIALERDSVSQLFATPDREEGVAAFLGKRPPRFDRAST